MAANDPQFPEKVKEASCDRLDSWKEIAAYLKRDERTVRRWEEEGLPIHRKVHKKQASVYAYRAEVDAWWTDGRKRLEAAPAQLAQGKHWKWYVIAAAVLVAAGAFLAVAVPRWRGASAAQRIRSIAVLPLRNLSGSSEYDYFAESLTDELTTNIARISALRVVSSTSVRRFKNAAIPVQEIAKQLNVDAVVEGSVVCSGNRVRITTQLVDARTDSHIWAQDYEREMKGIVEIQDAAALDIAEHVSATLAPGERESFQAHRVVNPTAYEAYLRGVYFLNKQTSEDVRRGIRSFEEAIAADQEYAPAYARSADCYMFLAEVGETPPSEAYSHAKAEAERALALDENLAEAHTNLANLAFFYDWDPKKAEYEFRRAIKLNPNAANTHQAYSTVLQLLGRSEESSKEMRIASGLDPVSLPTMHVETIHLYFAREYDEGLRRIKEAIELYPEAPMLHDFLSNIYFERAQLKEALEEALRAEQLWNGSEERLAVLKAAAQEGGLSAFWRKRIELNQKLVGQKSFNYYELAIDCAALGDKKQAVYWLRQALRMRDPKLLLIGVEPKFDSVRSDPRFVEIVHSIGLPSPN